MSPVSSPHARRLLLSGIGVGLLVVGTAFLLRPEMFYRILTRMIVVDDPLERADLIYVLNGRVEPRVNQAARLYSRGLAPLVLVPQTREMAHRPLRPLSDLMASEIVAKGVPDNVVTIVPFEGGVVDTRDEGRALREHLESHPVDRVIVVTMDYHTGRAQRTLSQELRGLDVEILMAAASDPRAYSPDDWWLSSVGRKTYLGEFAKQIATIIVGIWPA